MGWTQQGLKIFARSVAVRARGFKQYPGSPRQIIRAIIDDCWNSDGRFFTASAGHFKQFWIRDFGLACSGLLKLGHRKRVLASLAFALKSFKRAGTVTTTVFPNGKTTDFPAHTYSPDSLAFLLRSLRLAKATPLVKKHKLFLELAAQDFAEKVVDPSTGLVKRAQHFSSMKDHSIRQSSCYNNVMVAVVHQELNRLQLANPLPRLNYEKRLVKHFWNGRYFYDDLAKKQYVAGDANVFPFWTGIVKNKKMLRSAIGAMQRAGLDHPFPLKYTAIHAPHRWIGAHWLTPNYEGTSNWTNIGLVYLQLLKRADKLAFARQYASYRWLIQTHKNFPELYDPSGKPYKNAVYLCDEGMLWSAMFLEL